MHSKHFLKNQQQLILTGLILTFLLCSFGLFMRMMNHSFQQVTFGDSSLPYSVTSLDTLQQLIHPTANDLAGFALDIGAYEGADYSSLQVSLLWGDSLETVQSWEVPATSIKNGVFHPFVLSKSIPESEGEDFLIAIQPKNIRVPGSLVFWGTPLDPGSQSQLTTSDERNLELLLSYQELYRYKGTIAFPLTMLAVLSFGIVLILLFLKGNLRYVAAAVLVGLFYLFTMPVSMAPDEPAHFFRSYEISTGHLVSDPQNGGGRELPSSLLAINSAGFDYFDVQRGLTQGYDDRDTQFLTYSGAALYAPVQYVPQVIGISVMRLFTNNPFLLAYAGRLSNLLVCMVIFWGVLRLYPFSKNTVFLLFMLPIVMQGQASLSADGFTLAVCMFFLAYIMKSIYTSTPITNRDTLLICILATMVGLCKITYFPFVLLLLLLPSHKFPNKRKRWLFLAVVLGVSFLINLLWLSYTSRYLGEIANEVNPGQQLQFILSHPFQYLQILFHTFFTYFSDYVRTALTHMGWHNIRLRETPINLYTLVMAAFCVLEAQKSTRLNAVQRTMLGGIAFIIVALIHTALYIQWTPVEAELIIGVQGRYFIPILPLLLCMLHIPLINPKFWNKNGQILSSSAILVAASINIYALLTIYLHFTLR